MTNPPFALAYCTQVCLVTLMQAFPRIHRIGLGHQITWLQTGPALLKVGKTQSVLGQLYCQQREWDKAVGAYLRSLNAFNQAEDTVSVGHVLTHLSIVFAHRQQYRWAYDYAARAVQQLHLTEDTTGYAAALHTLGMNYFYLRRYRAALKSLEKALALRHDQGDNLGEAITLGCMGRVYDAQGERWYALACYEAALEGYGQYQPQLEGHRYEVIIRIRIARLALNTGHSDLAIAHFEAALVLCQTYDQDLMAEIFADLANAYDQAQQPAIARRYRQHANRLGLLPVATTRQHLCPKSSSQQLATEGYY